MQQDELQQEIFIIPVTIKECKPLYKLDTKTNQIIEGSGIELVTFEENGFEVVKQKGLVSPGESHYYVFPDTLLKPDSIVYDHVDEKKLGKVNGEHIRIKAVKFNWGLSKTNPTNIFSNGVVLTNRNIGEYLNRIEKEDVILDPIKLQEALGLYKQEEEWVKNLVAGFQRKGMRSFPIGISRTDETNIKKCSDDSFPYPCTVIGTLKVDGSSITFGSIKNKVFLTSRNIDLSNSIYVQRINGTREATLIEKASIWLRTRFPSLKRFISRVDLNTYETVFNEDNDFVKYGFPLADSVVNDMHGDGGRITGYKTVNTNLVGKDQNIIFRGELSGKTMKGSGNKHNPHSKLENKVRVFGGEFYNGVNTTNIPYDRLVQMCEHYDFEMVPTIFRQVVNSQEELMKLCNDYFKDNMVEGIVVRNNEQTISFKVMNDSYDEKK